jgi:streptogramin lyase
MDLLKDRHDALWVATTGQGLYRILDGQVEHFGAADGMSSDVVTKLFEDSEGDVWAATGNGLDVFRDLKVTTFSTREGLVGNRIDGVLGLRDGTLWAASDIGLNLLPGGQTQAIQRRQLLPGNRVTSLLEDRLGRLWVGADNTMSIYQGERFHPIKRGNGRPLGLVVGIAEDVENDVWAEIGGPSPELVRIRDLQVREVLPASRVPAARRVAADPNGGIWLGLMSGDLAHYRNGSLEQFHYPHRANSKVEDLLVNPDGTVFAATAFGLLGWRNGKQQILTVRNGLPCDGINAVINDGRGSLWLYTQCGLVQIADQELDRWWGKSDAALRMRVLDAVDGV